MTKVKLNSRKAIVDFIANAGSVARVNECRPQISAWIDKQRPKGVGLIEWQFGGGAQKLWHSLLKEAADMAEKRCKERLTVIRGKVHEACKDLMRDHESGLAVATAIADILVWACKATTKDDAGAAELASKFINHALQHDAFRS